MKEFENSVSVIIPNYNNSKWLEKCIQSCLNQGEYLKEIIFVDDHSTDNSVDLANDMVEKSQGKLKIYINPDKGANSARNFGFTKCTGSYIQWLDSDDMILPGKFENQLRVLHKLDGDIIYSDWRLDYYKDQEVHHVELKKCSEFTDYLYQLLLDNWTCSHNYLIIRDVAEEMHDILAWNPSTKVGQDREYFTCMALMGWRFVYVEGVYSVYNRWSNNTVSGIEFDKRLELNQILEDRFRNLIANSDKIVESKKRKYLKVLNTHLIKAKYYNRKIKLSKLLFPWDLNWNMIHWKMRLYTPLLLFAANIELLIGKNQSV